MNSGIYALYWWEQDLVYIGLSQSLSNRRIEHFSLLKNNRHTNYKVQNAYNQYGKPEFIILENCKISELPEKEILWCKEFDALGSRGLCLVEPGKVGFGPNSNSSKYTKRQILKVFSLLYKGKSTYIQIGTRLRVSHELVKDISKGFTHLWLKEQYPEKHNKMLTVNRLKLSASTKHASYDAYILQPEGNILHITNLYEAANKYFNTISDNDTKNIVEGLRRLLTGKRSQYRGYTLHSNATAQI